jgi:uncharacterized membrane protein
MKKIKENGLIDDKYELIIKEFQTILSVFYLLLVGIGMLFSYSKYSQFDINIFQYSDVFDFLLTPFRDITIFIFTFITILSVYVVLKLDSFTKMKFPKFYNSKFNFRLTKSKSIQLLSIVMLFILYLTILSGRYGKTYKKQILARPKTIKITLNNGMIKTGNLLGKNNGYVFLLENNNNEVNIYPITNVISIKKTK